MRVLLRVCVAGALAVSIVVGIQGPPATQAVETAGASTARIPGSFKVAGRVKAYVWTKQVPEFPRKVRGFQLDGTSVQTETRLFEPEGWKALIPLDRGLAGHCDSWMWVVRWRSRNPDVVVASGLLDTALPPPYSPLRMTKGGAGYMTGSACVSPGLRFDSTLNGNASNLVDIDYEYQVWRPKRGI